MILVKTHSIIGKIMPCNHIGTMRSGFHATAPKITGSLMLKIPGTKQALPNAFNSFDLEKHIKITKDRVAPIPPIHR